mmetsp:Transcript_3377/g.3863  ORF Transcript_3377/g.3863 Transcript_3377/m.3863 type:complete len:206 (-) Transcript_3377:202-819(-)|eukprot:CAMPEP_0185767636 /NCGR_PEP_ID=MMETSP1174-20130828/45462_1 /TAXON_ID=35687 /ORGANISM="Dictyocha speculum, Strain CCMP1381" /LENGTH=205 /DNA_ID=CAMNT_0028451953 /DNA_START=30 /DNA_END=647 /DNA_ORIENTATION=+
MASSLPFKVVLLGEGRVGKTSILLRYVNGEYREGQASTLQASYLDKRIIIQQKPVQLSIWDTAGQERFHSLVPIYYRDASGAVLVYDITDYESFSRVRKWVRELRQMGDNDICIIICGNKIDLAKDRTVTEEEATEYAQSVNAQHIYTSAKQGKGLDEAFNSLSTRMLEQRRQAASTLADIAPLKSRLKISDSDDKPKSMKPDCC